MDNKWNYTIIKADGLSISGTHHARPSGHDDTDPAVQVARYVQKMARDYDANAIGIVIATLTGSTWNAYSWDLFGGGLTALATTPDVYTPREWRTRK